MMEKFGGTNTGLAAAGTAKTTGSATPNASVAIQVSSRVPPSLVIVAITNPFLCGISIGRIALVDIVYLF